MNDDAPAVFDRDEAFWVKIRTLPVEAKERAEIMPLLVFKSKLAMMNRDIEDAIELRLAGWSASFPNGPLEIDRIFAWQWRKPGPRGGTLYKSTAQAISALRKQASEPVANNAPVRGSAEFFFNMLVAAQEEQPRSVKVLKGDAL